MDEFEKYLKRRYLHHCHPAIFNQMNMAKDVRDAFEAGQASRQAEIDHLKLALSGKTMSYDPASYKAGMLVAAEIAQQEEGELDGSNHDVTWGNACSACCEAIKAKAEEVS